MCYLKILLLISIAVWDHQESLSAGILNLKRIKSIKRQIRDECEFERVEQAGNPNR